MAGDDDYRKIVGKYYNDADGKQLLLNANNSYGEFIPETAEYQRLKENEYVNYPITWAKNDDQGNVTPEDYAAPWLSMYKSEKAEIQLVLNIEDDADYIEFEENSNFRFTPNKFDIAYKTGKRILSETVTVECLREFTSDETIIIHAYQQPKETKFNETFAGAITVWANAKSRQRAIKMVFVEVKTPAIASPYMAPLKGNASDAKTNMSKILRQAYINMHPANETIILDLSANENLKPYISPLGKLYSYSPDRPDGSLHDLLKSELSASFSGKYDSYVKFFYLGNKGQDSFENPIGGYSLPGADYVIVFANAAPNISAHEFMHACGLAHSFANREADPHASYTFKARRTDNLMDYGLNTYAMWHWQWVKANNALPQGN